VYSAVVDSKLSAQAWDLLRNRLPELAWWESWDCGKRLRLGIVDLFVVNGLPVEDFFELTENEKTFQDLVSEIRFNMQAKKYLLAASRIGFNGPARTRKRARWLQRQLQRWA
jgi:hypothetical protein